MGNVEFANICERFSDDYRLRPLFSFRVEDNQSDFKSVCRSEEKPPSPPQKKEAKTSPELGANPLSLVSLLWRLETTRRD